MNHSSAVVGPANLSELEGNRLDEPRPSDDPAAFNYPLSSSIGSHLRKTHRLFERDLQNYLAEFDIPIGMWYFFRALWEEDGLSQRELSDRAGSTAPAAVEYLRNMERRGYIERRRDGADKRKVFVFLTDAGRDLKRLLPYAAEVNAIALEGLTDGEIGFLRLVLARMKENFARRAALQERKPVARRARVRNGPSSARP